MTPILNTYSWAKIAISEAYVDNAVLLLFVWKINNGGNGYGPTITCGAQLRALLQG